MGRGGAAETSHGGSTVPAKGFQLVGASNFKRNNPMTDHFEVDRFHHIEFWCADATSTWKRCDTVPIIAPRMPRLSLLASAVWSSPRADSHHSCSVVAAPSWLFRQIRH